MLSGTAPVSGKAASEAAAAGGPDIRLDRGLS